MRLTDMLNLSVVNRWGTVPRLKEQTVGDHTFRMLVIFTQLVANFDHYKITAYDLWHALEHDGPECYSGDVPTPFKRDIGHDAIHAAEAKNCPWYREPDKSTMSTPEIYWCFKAADLIESYTWLRAWGHGPQAKRIMAILVGEIQDLPLDQEVLWSVIGDIVDEEGVRGGRGLASG